MVVAMVDCLGDYALHMIIIIGIIQGCALSPECDKAQVLQKTQLMGNG